MLQFFLSIFIYFLSLFYYVSFSSCILISSTDLVQIISDQFMMFILSQWSILKISSCKISKFVMWRSLWRFQVGKKSISKYGESNGEAFQSLFTISNTSKDPNEIINLIKVLSEYLSPNSSTMDLWKKSGRLRHRSVRTRGQAMNSEVKRKGARGNVSKEEYKATNMVLVPESDIIETNILINGNFNSESKDRKSVV